MFCSTTLNFKIQNLYLFVICGANPCSCWSRVDPLHHPEEMYKTKWELSAVYSQLKQDGCHPLRPDRSRKDRRIRAHQPGTVWSVFSLRVNLILRIIKAFQGNNCIYHILYIHYTDVWTSWDYHKYYMAEPVFQSRFAYLKMILNFWPSHLHFPNARLTGVIS